MKQLIAILALSMATLAFGQNTTGSTKTGTTKPAKKTAAKKPAPQAVTIPTDAVANPDGTYSYTDKTGKKWIYVKTPFGISRTEDISVAGGTLVTRPASPEVKAIDKGDIVTFQRNSPFGTTSWDKKKTDLTDEEKRILEAQKQPQPE